ncbi:MAG: helicase, partial [Bradyrhizobium sp.]|nr:helicase [Bradyrhizobium sp.]
FQLVEALGVIERAKIANEMKDLDQPSRATLRKYGVRFGAYHIYVPALLKPAARALAALLWAEKQGNVDMSALTGAQHLASSGRTSFPVDKALPRDAYRVLGYKQAGERAVRVDILERLADLIRPALAWRENAPGEKPAGAFDGRSFVVTQAMTSLTGSAGEDFASILRALGYRMEKRPPLSPKVVEQPAESPAAEVSPAAAEATGEAVVAETPSADAVEASSPEQAPTLAEAAVAPVTEQLMAAPEALAESPAQTAPADEAPAPVSALASLPLVDFVARAAAGEPEAAAPDAAAPDAVAVDAASGAAETEAAQPATGEATPAGAASAEAVPAEAEPAVAAEPVLIEVWRPGGRSEERRPRHDHHQRNRHQRPQHDRGQPAAGGQQAGGEQAAGAAP